MRSNTIIQSVWPKTKEVWLLLLLLLTPFRAITIVLSPLIVFFYYRRFHVRLGQQRRFAALFVLFFISSGFGLIGGTTSLYSVVLSCVICLPMYFMLFGEPVGVASHDFMKKKFATPFMIMLVAVNLLGLCYWLFHGGGDEYGWAYGRHYEYVHGLAMIDSFIFLYYVIKLLYGHLSKKEWYLFIFISISLIACGYGLGFICLFLTFLVFLLFMGRSKSLIILLALGLSAYAVSQSSFFYYERRNITKVIHRVDIRKLTMFEDFFKLVKDDPQILLLGTGPGGYNSRSTFLLCGDNENFINKALGNVEPPYYKKYIYPLWNNSFVSQEAFTDGTRNKPYSNFVSIWAEQGLFFLAIVIIMYYYLIKRLKRYQKHRVGYHFLLALDTFMIISLISHLWLETTEFMVYCLIRYYMLLSLKNEQALTDLDSSNSHS